MSTFSGENMTVGLIKCVSVSQNIEAIHGVNLP